MRKVLPRLGLVLPLLAGLPGEALAQPASDPSVTLAEGLFQQARGLVKQERWSEACPKLAESQRLDPKLGTLLNLAHCHENEGKIATAWAEYTSALSLAEKTGKKDREGYAKERIDALNKRLAFAVLHFNGQPPPGLALFLDDKPLPLTALYEKVPVDPGKRKISATAPGKRAYAGEIDVPPWPGDVSLSIPTLDDAPPPPPDESDPQKPPAEAPRANEKGPAAPLIAPTARTARAPHDADKPDRHATILMALGFGGGAAGLIVGAVTGIATLAKAGDIVPNCAGSSCPASAKEDIATANTLANASNIGFGVALVGLGVGITGLALMRPDAEAGPKKAVTVSPFVGAGTLGVRGAF